MSGGGDASNDEKGSIKEKSRSADILKQVDAKSELLEVVVLELEHLFQTKSIRELDFFFSPLDESSSDPTRGTVIYIEEAHVIGLSAAILKPLYAFSYGRMFDAIRRQKLATKEDGTDISSLLREIYRYSFAVLAVKGDLAIAYNYRKDYYTHLCRCTDSSPEDLLQWLRAEVNFLSAVFSKHPKSPAAWEHRRWCYVKRVEMRGDDSSNEEKNAELGSATRDLPPRSLTYMEVVTEKELCRVMAEKYPKNYYAWMHRCWLLQQMDMTQLDDELLFTEQWLCSHSSDHSAVNHRMQVVQHILRSGTKVILPLFITMTEAMKESSNLCLEWCTKIFPFMNTPSQECSNEGLHCLQLQLSFLVLLFDISEHMLTNRPGMESLWCHRRHLFELILQKCAPGFNEVPPLQIDELMGVINKLLEDVRESDKVTSIEDSDYTPTRFLTFDAIGEHLTNESDSSTVSFFWKLMWLDVQRIAEGLRKGTKWNYDQQVSNGMYYLLFIIERTEACFRDRGITWAISTQLTDLRSFLSSRGRNVHSKT